MKIIIKKKTKFSGLGLRLVNLIQSRVVKFPGIYSPGKIPETFPEIFPSWE